MANIDERGMNMGDLVDFLYDVQTLIEELHDDHATMKTYLDNLKILVNQVRTAYLTRVFSGNPGFAIASNFDIQNGNAFQIVKDGVIVTVSANTTFDTGTTASIAADKWGVALLSVNSDGSTTYVDWETNSGNGYSSEALAIAAIDSITASGHVVCGYVTVKTAAGQAWTAGTDALQGGTGGNPSSDTNYYNHINPDATLIGSAISDTLSSLSASKPSVTVNDPS